MKTKYLATMFSVLLLMGAIVPMMRSAKAQVQPTVYVDPATLDLTGQPIGYTFTVSVKVNSGDYHVWSGQIGIAWNIAVLDCTAFAKGADVDGTWLWMPGTINHVAGYVSYTGWSCVAGQEPGWPATTPAVGEFIKYTFQTVGYGDSTLDLTTATISPDKFYRTKLNQKTDSSIVEITPLTLGDGSVTYPAPPPYGPTAHLTAVPSIGYAPLAVHFDGSTSTPGFNGTDIIPIDWYYFDSGDGLFTQNSTSPTADYTYPTEGVYTATLIVHAPVGVPPTPETDDDTKVVTVKKKVEMGATGIDVYTQNYRSYMTHAVPHYTPFNGTGPNQAADAFQPQDLVTLYAKVTYGGDVVAHKLVAFEVHYPNGTIVLVRTAMTGLDGIAFITFRIPSPCDGPETVFGTWWVYVDVDIAEVKYNDTMTFRVGWIIDTYNNWWLDPDGLTAASGGVVTGAAWMYDATLNNLLLWVEPDPVKKTQDLCIHDGVINIAFVDVDAFFAYTLYDDQSFPIGFYSYTITVPGTDPMTGDPLSPIVVTPLPDVTMTIPAWAFVGPNAACYVNAYTALPSLCGIPYSPEEAVTFGIEPAP